MTAAVQPVTFVGQFILAPDQSLPQYPVPFNYTGSYVALEASLLNVTAPSSVNVPFGSIVAPGAKGLLLRYDLQSLPAAPVRVTLNGADEALEIAPGGFLAYFNPAPADGLTSAAIEVTAACQLRVWVLA